MDDENNVDDIEEQNNVSDTAENELTKEKLDPNNPLVRKLRDQAVSQTKEATKKARRKIRSSLFKGVGRGALGGLLPILIVVFMLIGIISFITSMPGVVEDMIMKKIMEVANELIIEEKGPDGYLEILARDSDRKAQKEVLKYLDDMGLEPSSLGFAAFYTRNEETDEIEYSNQKDLNDIVEMEESELWDPIEKVITGTGLFTGESGISRYLTKHITNVTQKDLSDVVDTDGNKVLSAANTINNVTGLATGRTIIGGLINNTNFKPITDAGKAIAKTLLDFNSARDYNAALARKVKSEDLIFKYIVSNERSYLVHYNDEDSKSTWDSIKEWLVDALFLPGNTGKALTGMIKMDGKNDNVQVSVDREDKVLELSGLTTDFENWKTFEEEREEGHWETFEEANKENNRIGEKYKQTSKFNLEGYAGRYGMSLEYLLALHLATMTSDLTEEMITNDNLQTSVYLDYTTSTYRADFKIKYDGKDLPIGLGDNEKALTDLCPPEEYVKFGMYTVYVDGVNKEKISVYLDKKDEFAQKIKDNFGCITVRSLAYWFEQVKANAKKYVHEKKYDDLYKEYIEAHGYVEGETQLSIEEALKGEAAISEAENELIDSEIERVFQEVLETDDIDAENLTTTDIEEIRDELETYTNKATVSVPYIKYVIGHWYKDVIFKADENNKNFEDINVYDETNNTIELPVTGISNEKLEATVILSGGRNYTQTKQPYVVKGNVVTLDGEVVTDNDLAEKVKNEEAVIENNADSDVTGTSDYVLGSGYRTTKKLFTEGRYYTYDGTQETAKSVWYAKQIENIYPYYDIIKEGDDPAHYSTKIKKKVQQEVQNRINNHDGYAYVTVTDGRIKQAQILDSEQAQQLMGEYYSTISSIKNENEIPNNDNGHGGKVVTVGDGWVVMWVMRATGVNEETENYGKTSDFYFVRADADLHYKSPAHYTFTESQETVDRINSLLEAMGVVTQRQPISFDNKTASGDVMSLTAFSILEQMHTLDAEYIYRDLKEFLIELGYYTKSEFEYISTNVLTWFMPDYIPETEEEQKHWRQNRENDVLSYGAIIYPSEKDSEGEITHKGFEEGMSIVAPGNCRLLSIEEEKMPSENGDVEKYETCIKIEFDGLSQPEIGMLDGYTMIIKGIIVNRDDTIKVQNKDGDEFEVTIQDVINNLNTYKKIDKDKLYIIKAGETIGYTGTSRIQVVLRNARGALLDNVEDYMSPDKSTSYAQVNDLGYFYFVPYEGGRPGMVSNASNEREVAVGIGQWTTYGTTNNIPIVCKKLYELDPVFCSELQEFINWSSDQILDDFFEGGDELKNAFQVIEDKDKEKFMQLQMQVIIEEKTQLLNSRGLGWVMDRNPVTVGTVWSCYNWGPNMGWEDHLSESMTDEQIIISMLKYACTGNSTMGSLATRWNPQAKLAIDILHGDFTDIQGWIENKGNYPEYNEGHNMDYLSTK